MQTTEQTRYSDADLAEFRILIEDKLSNAKQQLDGCDMGSQ